MQQATATGQALGQCDSQAGKVTCLAFGRTGTLLVSGSDDGTALLWPKPPAPK